MAYDPTADLAIAKQKTTEMYGNTDPMAPAPTNPSAPVVVQPSQVTGSAPLTLPQPTGGMTQADTTVAGATQTSTDLQKYLDQLQAPTTALDTQNKSLSDTLSSLYGLDTGKAQATAQAETAAGLPDLQKQYADINSQILTKNAEYEKMFSSLDTQPGVTTAVATAEQNGLRRSQAADIGLLQARALGLQGQIGAAQDAVSRAINLKYQGIEEDIAAKEKQLALIQPQLNQQQQKVAQAQQLMLADQKQQIADQKDLAKANINLAIDNKVNTKFANKRGEIFDVNSGVAFSTPEDFFKAAGVKSFEEAYAKGLITDINQVSSIDLKQYPASYQEYLLAKQDGYNGSYNDYQTMDANRKAVRSTTNNITYGQSVAAAQTSAASTIGSALAAKAGGDGYVSPEEYKRARAAWVSDGYSSKDFNDQFNGYVNPADKQDYGV